MKGSFTFWAATQALLIAYRATIPHMKGDIQGFHMSPKTAMVTSDFPESRT